MPPTRLTPPSPSSWLRIAAEGVLLLLVVLCPWPFASVQPFWEAALTCLIAILVLLWSVHVALSGRLTFRPGKVTLALAGLLCLTAFQLVSLPEPLLKVLSPHTVAVTHELTPAEGEVLPGETAPGAPRPSWSPISLDPYSTRLLAGRLLTILLLFVVVRDWLASRESFRRLAFVLTGNGVALALVALAQFMSSPRNVIFWSVDTEGQVFGPFVCRNHYPDYLNFAIGLCVGLILRPLARGNSRSSHDEASPYQHWTARIFQSPEQFLLKAGLVIMVVSLPFSLSRGAIATTFLAGLLVAGMVAIRQGMNTRSLLTVGAVLAVALGLGGWLGWGPVQERFAHLWQGASVDNRFPMWHDAWTGCTQFLATGLGGGSFARGEPLFRTQEDAVILYDYAHNEYLEALFEGGIPRLLLTLGLVAAVLHVGYRAARRLEDQSTGPLALGSLFALAALIMHSVVDFGIHIPAVAVVATVVLAHLVAASEDGSYIRMRKGESRPQLADRMVFTGVSAIAVAGVLGILAVAMAWLSIREARADALREKAAQLDGSQSLRLQYLAERVRLTPDNPDALHDLGQAFFASAGVDQQALESALAGTAMGHGVRLGSRPQLATGHSIAQGLAWCRAARAAGPLAVSPHVRMGQYADYCLVSEPASIHLGAGSPTPPCGPRTAIGPFATSLTRGGPPPGDGECPRNHRLEPTIDPAGGASDRYSHRPK